MESLNNGHTWDLASCSLFLFWRLLCIKCTVLLDRPFIDYRGSRVPGYRGWNLYSLVVLFWRLFCIKWITQRW